MVGRGQDHKKIAPLSNGFEQEHAIISRVRLASLHRVVARRNAKMTWKTDRVCVRVLEVVLQFELHRGDAFASAELWSGRPAISRAYQSNVAQSYSASIVLLVLR